MDIGHHLKMFFLLVNYQLPINKCVLFTDRKYEYTSQVCCHAITPYARDVTFRKMHIYLPIAKGAKVSVAVAIGASP